MFRLWREHPHLTLRLSRFLVFIRRHWTPYLLNRGGFPLNEHLIRVSWLIIIAKSPLSILCISWILLVSQGQIVRVWNDLIILCYFILNFVLWQRIILKFWRSIFVLSSHRLNFKKLIVQRWPFGGSVIWLRSRWRFLTVSQIWSIFIWSLPMHKILLLLPIHWVSCIFIIRIVHRTYHVSTVRSKLVWIRWCPWPHWVWCHRNSKLMSARWNFCVVRLTWSIQLTKV